MKTAALLLFLALAAGCSSAHRHAALAPRAPQAPQPEPITKPDCAVAENCQLIVEHI